MPQINFPKHECGLFLTHNEHKNVYEPAGQWIVDNDAHWPSEEEKAKAIETDEVWSLIWYPNTSIGSYHIAAATLETLLEFARKIEEEA